MVSIQTTNLEDRIKGDTLNRPSRVLGQLYDFVKNGIDTYLN